MKKIITTVSLAAIGATGAKAFNSDALSPSSPSKVWSVSAALRGFYDDNYTTAPSKGGPAAPNKRSSWGFEVSPSFNINIPLEQTFIGLGYTYRFTYYEDRDFSANPEDPFDQTHQANLKLDHRFTDSTRVEVRDTFVASVEPTIVDPDFVVTPGRLRTDSDIFRNTGSFTFTTELTPTVGAELGYTNNYYDYEQDGPGSRSALLDRMNHLASASLRWQALPKTIAILGYQYGRTDYLSDDPLTPFPLPAPFNRPEVRDSQSHFAFIGVDQTLTSQVLGSLRAGGQLTTYDNLPARDLLGRSIDDSVVSPYVDGSLSYAYTAGSYAQVGARYTRIPTDVAYTLGGLAALVSPTLDQESALVYGTINHAITAKLKGRVHGQVQYSQFQGGNADGNVDVFYLVGVNLTYQLSPNFSLEAGYNYDRLDSDITYVAGYPRSFTRNRVYFGIRGTL
jgi:hypothetical protein